MAWEVKNTSVSGYVPTPSVLLDGELFINTTDHVIYFKGADGQMCRTQLYPVPTN